MNYTTARCGHLVIAEGAPGSRQRKECERRTCGKARCRSGLSAKFSDAECDAWCWLIDSDIRGWTVDRLTKRVTDHEAGQRYSGLIEFQAAKGNQ